MRRLLSVFLLGLLIAAPALAQSPVTECDRLAGLRYAPRVPGAPGAEYIPEPALAIAACEAESARSPDDAYLRLQLGRAYLAGDRTDPRVARLYASAIGALPALARLRLGTLYDHGWAGLKHDQHRALALYSEACAMVGLPGALVGCNNVALLLFDLGDAAQFPRAMGMLESGCSAGDSYSCENFGYEFETGRHVARDLPRAVAIYRRACDAGSPLGCSNLGNALSRGFDGPVDLPGAVPLFRRACDMGEMYGCANLGWALWQGWDGPPDAAAARPLFERACQAEVAYGCGNLGDLYHDGAGVAQDRRESARLYTLGCDGGDAWSCFILGEQLLAGDGIAADPVRGRALIRQGCDLGETDACTRADELR